MTTNNTLKTKKGRNKEMSKRVSARVIMFGVLATICFGFGVYVFFNPVVPLSTTIGVVGNGIVLATAFVVGGTYIAFAVEASHPSEKNANTEE